MRKKYLKVLECLAMVFLFAVGSAHADAWYKTNQATVAWDAVTLTADGTPIPAADQVKYRIYTKTRSGAAETLIIETAATQQTISFSGEGFWYVGIRAVRYVSVDGQIPPGDEPLVSEIAWSSVAANCKDSIAFGIRNHLPPGQAKNIRVP